MATTRLYDRKYRLSVGDAATESEGAVNLNTGVLVTDLQMTFSINRAVKAENDKAEIAVYNLSEDTRNKFFQKDKICILEVAYGDGEFTQLFMGEIDRVSTTKQQADVVTTLIIGDGVLTTRETRSEQSFSPGVTLGKVIKRLVEQDLGLPYIPNNGSLGAGAGLNKVYSNGISVSAKTHSWIEKACADNDLDFFIQDGKAYTTPVAEPRSTSIVPLFTPDTGLLDSPKPVVPKKKQKALKQSADPDSGIKFKVLLTPSLQVGGRVAIKSKDVDGVYKLIKVKHQGDFRGASWYSDCEANYIPTETTTEGGE